MVFALVVSAEEDAAVAVSSSAETTSAKTIDTQSSVGHQTQGPPAKGTGCSIDISHHQFLSFFFFLSSSLCLYLSFCAFCPSFLFLYPCQIASLRCNFLMKMQFHQPSNYS